MIIRERPDADEKYKLMQQDGKYEIANSVDAAASLLEEIKGQAHAKKPPSKVPKIFLSNACIFNCAYCGCRSGDDCKRVYLTTPRELADFSLKVAKENKTGIFISSAIFKTPDYTGELICETMRILRQEYGYGGYLHTKVMPGTSVELIQSLARYADRLSVNIEVANSAGYAKVAVNKTRSNILSPMGAISSMLRQKREHGLAAIHATSQTTQLMAGSMGEDDYTILHLAQALYQKYHLNRVYYTSFTFKGGAKGYEDLPAAQTPKWRVHRLYQADRLIQEYGFAPEEIAPGEAPHLPRDLDPKAAWALRNLHRFPVEVNTADFEELIRIPGIGVTYANRILLARRQCSVTHDVLRQLGVSLKKSRHFLTCNGRLTGTAPEDATLLRPLICDGAGRDEVAQQTPNPKMVRYFSVS